MTRKVPAFAAPGNWVTNNVGTLITIATVCFSGAGFYFSTQASFASYGERFSKIERWQDQSEKRDEKQQREVLSERSSLRSEMTSRNDKLSESIGELKEKMAVTNTQMTNIQTEIAKISVQIGAAAATVKR